MNKKGQVAIYIVFTIVAIMCVFMGAFIAPMGVDLTSKLYVEGETLMLDANETISTISDTTIKGQIQDTISNAMLAQQNNIEVHSAIFQYGWILAIVLVGLVAFMFTRSLVEYKAGGGLI